MGRTAKRGCFERNLRNGLQSICCDKILLHEYFSFQIIIISMS